jgi:hypothetical protein
MKYLVAIYENDGAPLHDGQAAVRRFESSDVIAPEDAVFQWANELYEIEGS